MGVPASYDIGPADTATADRLIVLVRGIFSRVHPGCDDAFVAGLVGRVEALFAGRDGRRRAIDMAYHDFEHTMQTTLCLARIYEGAAGEPGADFRAEDFRCALAAMLYHDTGYLKSAGDSEGTGAKFTFVHETRSAWLAAEELAEMGWSESEVSLVRLLIFCTGPASRPDRVPFANVREKLLGSMVCSADFLGQMSDPAYPKKLPALFREFEEAYEMLNVPKAARPFASVEDLIARTPVFWRDFVLPKLTRECGDVWRFLATPDGRNPYREAVEARLRELAAG